MSDDARAMTAGRGAIKGTIFRGYLAYLDKVGAREAVAARVSPATRALIREPPLSSTWVDSDAAIELIDAYAVTASPADLRRMASEGVTSTVMPVINSFVQGIVRLFGATPGALYARFGTMLQSNFRGIDFEWRPRAGAAAGEMAVIHRGRHDGPATFETWAGGMEYVLKVTNTPGTVRVVSVDHVGPDTVARIEASWTRT